MLTEVDPDPSPLTVSTHSKIGEEVSLSCWGSSTSPVVTMISCVMTGMVPSLFDNTVFEVGTDTEGDMVVDTGAP